MTTEVQAVQVRRWTQVGGVIRTILEREDGAGNTIECEAVGDQGNGYVYCSLRHATTGAVLDDIIVRPADGMKLDTCSAWLRGGRVRLRFGNHAPGAQNPEVLSEDRYDWVPPHLVPIPTGGPFMGRPGGHDIVGVGGGEPVDYEQIRAIVRAELDTYTGRLRPHILSKTVEAIVSAGVIRTSTPPDELYAAFAKFIRDRAYEAVKAYDESTPEHEP